jgi:hypothetical protein
MSYGSARSAGSGEPGYLRKVEFALVSCEPRLLSNVMGGPVPCEPWVLTIHNLFAVICEPAMLVFVDMIEFRCEPIGPSIVARFRECSRGIAGLFGQLRAREAVTQPLTHW